ncbi:MAG: sugar kinase [Chloroflexota bacterium]
MSYDVITIGETMLRLSPPSPLTLEQSQHLEVHIGRSESNVAIGLARLGMRVAWLSRVTNNTLGDKLMNAIRAHGVDTSHVIRTDEDRVGLYWYESGSSPRESSVIYDRKNSAMANISPNQISAGIFQKGNAKLLHVTGISLAISDSAKATLYETVRLAKQAGFLISFDVNYRSLLWSPEQAYEACHTVAQDADLIFIAARDTVTLYDCSTDYDEAILSMSQLYPEAHVIMTTGKHGAMMMKGNQLFKQGTYQTQPIDRLGGGDAFVAGFLYAYLSNYSSQDCLRWGCASAAYKYSISGDIPLLNKHQIQKIVMGDNSNDLIR